MQLYLVRHPEPHEAGLCYGRRDIPIGAGALVRAAASVREHLSESELAHARLFSSPLRRCLLLARELAAPREPAVADELREMDFGSWEGRPWDAVPRDELDAWASDVWRYRPGGAESAELLAVRWRRWSSGLRASGIGTAVAVTHAGLIRVALHGAGVLTATEFARAPIGYGSVHRIEFDDAAGAR